MVSPFSQIIHKLELSKLRQERSVEHFEEVQKDLFDCAEAYLKDVYNFLLLKLPLRQKPFSRESFENMVNSRFGGRYRSEFDGRSHLDTVHLKFNLRWLQQLLLCGSCESNISDFCDWNEYFSGKSTDFDRLSCEVNLVFEPWENWINVELIKLPGEVHSYSETVRVQIETGKWRNCKRFRFRAQPDNAKVKMTLVNVPPVSTSKNGGR